MIPNNPEQPDLVDLLAMHRDQQNAVPTQRAARIDLTKIRARLAATDPTQVERMVEETEKLRLGQEAFDLAREYLAAGKLDRARHWLTVAVRHDIEDARPLLDDVGVILEAVDTPHNTAIVDGTTLGRTDSADERERQAATVDDLHDAAVVLRQAQERAQSIVQEAQAAAEEILTQARRTANAHDHAITAMKSLPDRQREAGLHRIQSYPSLTERDLLMLRCMAAGKSNERIGRELSLSVDTVSAHAQRLFRKLGVRDFTQAVGRAPRGGVIPFADEQAELKVLTGGGGQGKTLLAHALAGDAQACHNFWHWVMDYREETGHVHGDLATANILLAPHHGSGHFDIVDMGQSDVQLWTPATIAADRVIGDHGSVPHSYATHTFDAEQRPERERIVAGPKLRQAIDELKEQQLATTGT